MLEKKIARWGRLEEKEDGRGTMRGKEGKQGKRGGWTGKDREEERGNCG